MARMTSGASATNSAACLRMSVGIARGPAGVDPHVAADGPAQLLQPLKERREAGLNFRIVRGRGQEHADAPHALALLRVRGERCIAAALPARAMKSRRLMQPSPRALGTMHAAQNIARRAMAVWTLKQDRRTIAEIEYLTLRTSGSS